MKPSPNRQFDLADADLWHRKRIKGTRVTCLAGRLWLSLEGQNEDIFLSPGETYLVPDHGQLVIEGIGPAGFRLDPLRRAGDWWRTQSAKLRQIGRRPRDAGSPA